MPFLILLLALLCGCSSLGIDYPFRNDPITGGVDTQTSSLLNIPIPAGFQRYPSHGFISSSATGAREGLEVFRGNVNPSSAALSLFDSLHNLGWQLCLSLRKGKKMLYLYQRQQDFIIISFYQQGMLTILEIWSGEKLPDGSTLSPLSEPSINEEPHSSIAGEEYEPLNPSNPSEGKVETWGNNIEEREL